MRPANAAGYFAEISETPIDRLSPRYTPRAPLRITRTVSGMGASSRAGGFADAASSFRVATRQDTGGKSHNPPIKVLHDYR